MKDNDVMSIMLMSSLKTLMMISVLGVGFAWMYKKLHPLKAEMIMDDVKNMMED